MPPKKSGRARSKGKAKGNIITRFVDGIRRLIRETVGELRKVSWPTRQEALHLTRIVLVVIVVIGVYFFVVDSVLNILFKVLIGIG